MPMKGALDLLLRVTASFKQRAMRRTLCADLYGIGSAHFLSPAFLFPAHLGPEFLSCFFNE